MRARLSSSMKNAIVLFRNDLRLRDNGVLHLQQFSQAERVLAVYCFDDRFLNRFTRRFRAQALVELQRTWQKAFNVPLLCFHGLPEKVVPALARSIEGRGVVLFSDEIAPYEKASEAALAKELQRHGWETQSAWTYSLYHPQDLPFDVSQGHLPEPFTSARKQIESKRTPVRKPLPIPKQRKHPVVWVSSEAWRSCGTFMEDLGSLLKLEAGERRIGETKGEGAVYEDTERKQQRFWLTFMGGEMAAAARLDHFCASGLGKYKSLRNGSIGWEYSSKLSPYLAAGCISPRQIHYRVREFEEFHGESVHTYWVTFELLWRDYMRFFCWKHKERVFNENGPAGRLPNGLNWCVGEKSETRLQRWKDGRTGVPWVDGHMRELKQTGFMSNRGRQNVASFLIFNLKVDWRLGAQYFEDTLIDHDVSANWGNWVAAAGVASTSSRVNRFNMEKQARDYDPDAEHARIWVPELADVPKHLVHKLALRTSQMISFGVEPDTQGKPLTAYPLPIVSLAKPSSTERPWKKKPRANKKSKPERAHRGRQGTYYTY